MGRSTAACCRCVPFLWLAEQFGAPSLFAASFIELPLVDCLLQAVQMRETMQLMKQEELQKERERVTELEVSVYLD